MKAKHQPFSHLSTKTLIRRNLAESDEKKADKYLFVLHSRDTLEVFDGAIQLLKSKKVLERKLGINILSQLGNSKKTFSRQIIYYFLSFMKKEKSPNVLGAIGKAFYYLIDSHDHRFVEVVVTFADHNSSQVRFGVVQALLGHEHPLAIKTLIKLTEDANKEVRNWATFGLGSQIDSNTPAIRRALRSRLNEKDDELRGEALLGLAVRKYSGIKTSIIQELNRRNVGSLALQAAKEIANSKVLPALLHLRFRTLKWKKKHSVVELDSCWMNDLDEAIAEYDNPERNK